MQGCGNILEKLFIFAKLSKGCDETQNSLLFLCFQFFEKSKKLFFRINRKPFSFSSLFFFKNSTDFLNFGGEFGDSFNVKEGRNSIVFCFFEFILKFEWKWLGLFCFFFLLPFFFNFGAPHQRPPSVKKKIDTDNPDKKTK